MYRKEKEGVTPENKNRAHSEMINFSKKKIVERLLVGHKDSPGCNQQEMRILAQERLNKIEKHNF